MPAGSAQTLEGLRQLPLNATNMGVLHGVAAYWGFDASPATVFGATGYAFLINIKEDICPSGPFVWRRERFNRLVTNLGIRTRDLGFYTRETTAAERRRVDAELRDAIDAGIPCSLCNNEFQLITGYDGEGFSTVGPFPDHLPRRLTFGTWQEWGQDVYAYFYVYHRGEPASRNDLVRDSLSFAIEMFRSPDRFALDGYAVGPDAYTRWIEALDGHGESFGNEWNATVFAECRRHAASYLREVADWFPESRVLTARLAGTYDEVARNLATVAAPSVSLGEKRQTLARNRALEVSAIDDLERLLEGIPGNANTERPAAPGPRLPVNHDERVRERPPLLAEVMD